MGGLFGRFLALCRSNCPESGGILAILPDLPSSAGTSGFVQCLIPWWAVIDLRRWGFLLGSAYFSGQRAEYAFRMAAHIAAQIDVREGFRLWLGSGRSC
jgi:hypothetical protein